MAYGSVDTIADWIQDLAWGILDGARVGSGLYDFRTSSRGPFSEAEPVFPARPGGCTPALPAPPEWETNPYSVSRGREILDGAGR